jgi:hypothetical protein
MAPEGNTDTENGKRTVYLRGDQTGMTFEEQMRLAAVLGHEAYRDGYSTGETDQNGNVITKAMSMKELQDASIARILMGDRINQDHQWFYGYNNDFAIESFLYANANKMGDMTLFNDYLQITYKNDQDYFFQSGSTGGDHQNQDKYRSIPLFATESQERVAEINGERFDTGLVAYKADLAGKAGYADDVEAFMSQYGKTDEELMRELQNDKSLQGKFDCTPLKYETLYNVGCRFMTAKYIAESVSGNKIDTLKLNDLVREKNLFVMRDGERLLTNESVADIMTLATQGQYIFDLVQTGLPDAAELWAMDQSKDQYAVHARIKQNGTGRGYHSVMVSDFEYSYDDKGNVTGVKSVNVANPWNGGSRLTGQTSYTMDQIDRLDIYKPTKNYQTVYKTLSPLEPPKYVNLYDRIFGSLMRR